MNLFILSLFPEEVAKFMMDKHIVKIILEAVQMLCSARRVLLPADDETINAPLYKLAHKNHPVTIWCRRSRENFIWTLDLVDEMHKEWRFATTTLTQNFTSPTWLHSIYENTFPTPTSFQNNDSRRLRRQCPTSTNTKMQS